MCFWVGIEHFRSLQYRALASVRFLASQSAAPAETDSHVAVRRCAAQRPTRERFIRNERNNPPSSKWRSREGATSADLAADERGRRRIQSRTPAEVLHLGTAARATAYEGQAGRHAIYSDQSSQKQVRMRNSRRRVQREDRPKARRSSRNGNYRRPRRASASCFGWRGRAAPSASRNMDGKPLS